MYNLSINILSSNFDKIGFLNKKLNIFVIYCNSINIIYMSFSPLHIFFFTILNKSINIFKLILSYSYCSMVYRYCLVNDLTRSH